VIDDGDEESAPVVGARLAEAEPGARPQEKVSGDTRCALRYELMDVFLVSAVLSK
jgi:hypothetical protein